MTQEARLIQRSAQLAAEYNQMRAILAVIHPAKVLTEFMQSSSHPTLSMAWPRTRAVATWARNVKYMQSSVKVVIHKGQE